MGIRNSEEASHTVLYEEENIQIRQYEESLIAQTQTTGNYKESGNEAFRRLAAYIFGENTSKEKIEMTTPTLEKKQNEKISMTVPVFRHKDDNTWAMTFILPSKFTLETVPEPLNKNVEIKIQPAKKVATIRYAGLNNLASIEENSLKLKLWLDENDYITVSEAYSASYDPPWTIPILRRNEIHIDIQ